MFRRFLFGALLAATAVAALGVPAGAQTDRAVTQFEETNGATWSSYENELAFLTAVDEASERVQLETIGVTPEGRPLHLVRLGYPRPAPRPHALRQPTTLFVCTQHGNEPAGREACLQRLRDLAFSDNPTVISQLQSQTILFVPTANPDGRSKNRRTNSTGHDINRDHLNLETPETQAVAAVVRDWQPEAVVDLHEYGPSLPGVYDDEVLVLWPRNLNVDDQVYGRAKELAARIKSEEEAAGYTTDEYGQYKVGDYHLHQAAGDGDEGIARNAMGLRHSLGILVETRVDQDLRNGLDELTSAGVQRRRVAAHVIAIDAVLGFMRDQGIAIADITDAARSAAVEEGADRTEPVYFGGADNTEPSEEDVVDPPPCGYLLTHEQQVTLKNVLSLLEIDVRGGYVSMAQVSEPLIPLLLDERGNRRSTEATPVTDC